MKSFRYLHSTKWIPSLSTIIKKSIFLLPSLKIQDSIFDIFCLQYGNHLSLIPTSVKDLVTITTCQLLPILWIPSVHCHHPSFQSSFYLSLFTSQLIIIILLLNLTFLFFLLLTWEPILFCFSMLFLLLEPILLYIFLFNESYSTFRLFTSLYFLLEFHSTFLLHFFSLLYLSLSSLLISILLFSQLLFLQISSTFLFKFFLYVLLVI